MIKVKNIFEQEKIFDFLSKRGILSQYRNAKNKVLNGSLSKSLDLKYRKPKVDGKISFRINNQFRAFCYLEGENLIVYKIDNHQN